MRTTTYSVFFINAQGLLQFHSVHNSRQAAKNTIEGIGGGRYLILETYE